MLLLLKVNSTDLVYHVMVTEQIDTVMHFAASTHVDNSFGNSLGFTTANVAGTHVMLEAARACGDQIRRFVHVSTDEVYGENDSYDEAHGNQEDKTRLEPTNPYSASKAAAEMLVKAYARSYGLPVIVTRGNNVFGPNQFPEKLIPKAILMTARGMRLPVHGSGKNKRSYLYVEDVAEAFDCVLHKGETGRVYNIGTTVEQTVLEVVTSVASLMRPDAEVDELIEHVDDRPFNDLRYYLDCSSLTELGWQQRTPFIEGLKKTVAWYTRSGVEEYWGAGAVERVLVAHPRKPGDKAAGCTTAAELKRRELKLIMSSGQLKDLASPSADGGSSGGSASAPKFLLFGRTGWLGGMLAKLLHDGGHDVSFASSRLEHVADVEQEIERSGCTHVLNAAGLTGRPNVDWCEEHKAEVLRVNVIGTLALAAACRAHGVHLTNLATGCIFHYDEAHPQDAERDAETLVALDEALTFTETDEANFDGSFYSVTKGHVESLLRSYDNVLTLRVRMPIDAAVTTNSRNFVYKIAHYERVVDIPNSMTVLPELLPYAIELALRGRTGVFNYTNPGAISHGQVLELYREYIDPSFEWEHFSVEEQAMVIKAGRSNNELSSRKLWAEFPDMLPIRQSLIKYVFEPAREALHAEKAAAAEAASVVAASRTDAVGATVAARAANSGSAAAVTVTAA